MPFGPPRDLSASVVSDTRIDLAWRLCANGTMQALEWRDDQGRTSNRMISGTATSASLTGLTPGTEYTMAVTIFYSTSEVARSQEVVATTTRSSAPNPPTNVRLATISNTIDALTLTFTDNATNEDRFTLEIVDTLSGHVEQRQLPAASSTGSVTSRVGGLQAARTYRMRLRAENSSGGASAWSDFAEAATPFVQRGSAGTVGTEPTYPDPPFGVRAVAVAQDTITVSWGSIETFASGHRVHVYFGTDLRQRVETSLDAREVDVTGLSAETTYTVRVSTFREDLESFAELDVDVTTLPRRGRQPGTPTDIKAVAISLGHARIIATVVDVEIVDSIEVWRTGVSPSIAAAKIATVAIADFAAGYIDSGVTAGNSYKYHVIALAEGVASDASDFSDDLVIPAAIDLPVVNFSISADELTDYNVIVTFSFGTTTFATASLSYNDSLGSGGPWTTLVASLSPTQTAYLHSLGGEPLGTLWYRLRLTNTFGSEELTTSIDLQGLVAAAPTGPIITKAVAVGPTRARIEWASTDFNTTSWTVQRRLTGATSWSSLATVASTTIAYNDSGLSPQTFYEYRVLAVNAAGSGASEVFDVLTARSTTGAAPHSSIRQKRTYARPFGKDDADAALGTAQGPGTVVIFRSAPADSNGPFAELAINGTVVTPLNATTGVAECRQVAIETGDVLTVEFSGTSTGFGDYVMVVDAPLA